MLKNIVSLCAPFIKWPGQHRLLASGSLLAVIASLLTGRPIIMLAYALTLLVAYLPLKGAVVSSLAPRIVIALTVITCLLQLEALGFWAADVWVSSTIYGFTTLVVVLIWLIKANSSFTRTVTVRLWIDLAVIVPCLLIGGAYLAKTFAGPTDHRTAIVRSINFGMDDSTHAHMLVDILHHDNNILASSDRQQLLSRPSTRAYPMGWHITSGIFANSTLGQQDRTAMQAVTVYFYAKFISLLYAVAVLAVFVTMLISRLTERAEKLSGALMGVIVSLFVSFVTILPLFYEGFFSFLPIVAFTLLFAGLLISKASASGTKLALLTLLTVASATSWILTSPIMLLALAVYCLGQVRSWRQLNGQAYLALGLGTVALVLQSYIIVMVSKTMVTHLNAPGGITTPNHLLLVVGIASVAYLLIAKNKDYADVGRQLLGMLVGFGAAMAAVLLYIAMSSNEITYYYYKLQSAILPILLSLIAVLVVAAVFRMANQEKNSTNRLVYLALAPILLCLMIPGLIGYEYFRNIVNRSTSFGIGKTEASILASEILNEKPASQRERSYFVVPDEMPLNILGSNTSRLAYASVSCDYDIFRAVYAYDLPALNKELLACTPKLPTIHLYSTKEGMQQLRTALSPTLLQESEVILTHLK